MAAALGHARFVPQSELPDGEAYEAFIRRSGRVPTRDNLHDLFNGLVWLRFPALKQRLNELHAAQIAIEGIAAARGPLRDALTLFDENGAWWQAPAPLLEALQRRDWHALFVTHRRTVAAASLTLVGHALMEKLVRPRKADHRARVGVDRRARRARAASRARRGRASPSCPCPCWACRVGGRPTKSRASTTTPACSAPPADNRPREAGQTAAGARTERLHGRKVRTAQGGVAANGCPARAEDQSNRDESVGSSQGGRIG